MNRSDMSLEELRQAVLAKQLKAGKARTAGRNEMEAIAIADRGKTISLSFGQQRLWFLDQLDRRAGLAYHIPIGLRLFGRLNRQILRAALDAIVARHEGLRARFLNRDGVPYQEFLEPDCGFTLTELNLDDLSEADRDAALERIFTDEIATPFALDGGPLIRGLLLRMTEDKHVLIVTQHHIVTDGWSTRILIDEVCKLYTNLLQGRPDPLPVLPLQYADYAMWQRGRLQGERLERQIAFWRDHLDGAPALLDMPVDRPRPATPSHAGGNMQIALEGSLTVGLRALAMQHGATLFMVLLAGWAALLSRISGQADVMVGIPVANRQHPELENVIGFFVNMIPLRVSVGAAGTAEQLIDQVRRNALAGYAHQEVPFEQVVDAINPERSLAHSPLFQTFLSMNNGPTREQLSMADLRVEAVSVPSGTTQFDLALTITEFADSLLVNLDYAADLFEHPTVERLCGQFRTMLSLMVEGSDLPLSSLSLIAGESRTQLLVEAQGSRLAVDVEPVAALFEEQVRRTPLAPALEYEGGKLSYDTLNRRANQLAHYLRGSGIGREDRVAICMGRGLGMVVGILGVLKAGAAYVPLDPGNPTERLTFMLEDSNATVMLSQSALEDQLPASNLIRLVLLNEEGLVEHEGMHGQPEHDLTDSQPQKADLAYVIYTSGSTGRPKGVMVEHGGLSNYLEWARKYYIEDRVQHTVVSSPLAFDATITSLYLPLISGGQAILLREGGELVELPKLLPRLPAGTLIKITPNHLAALGQQLQSEHARCSAQLFVVGGEALSGDTAALWNRIAPGSRIVNEYGPTETVVGCSVYEADGVLQADGNVPIGRPICNTSIYLVDENLELVAPGAVGEICIGGAGVARGYLNRPEQTAERFVLDPFCAEPRARMYRSGDLGRRMSDGNLAYIGRKDAQVKIRGFRIELGEIETRLAGVAGVREAAVVTSGDGGARRLIGYVTALPGCELTAGQLREKLAAMLPEYMVPAAFLVLDEMPLTSNGKLDRKALPEPGISALRVGEYEAPEGEAEIAIAAVWQDLLKLPRVGRNDHFFELGGQSLMAIAVIGRLRELGLHAEVRTIFSAPRLSDLAAAVGANPQREVNEALEGDVEEFRI